MKNLKYGLLLLLTLFLTTSSAQKRLKTPLAFVPADSVVLWGESYNDLRGMALQVDKTLQARTISPAGKDYKKELKTWKKETLAGATLTGASANAEGNDEVIIKSALLVENAGRLFLESADCHFFNVAERTIWGDLLRKTISASPASFEKHTAAQALVDATGMIYATANEDLWVNLFTNSTTHVKTGNLNVIVDQLTGMPLEGRVKIRLTGYSRGRFHLRLHIRIPGWATGTFEPQRKYVLVEQTGEKSCPVFYINGRESLTTVIENGYFIIDRTWNTGDEVLFELPTNAYFVKEQGKKKQAETTFHLFRGMLPYTTQTADRALRITPNTKLTEKENEDGVVLYETKDEQGKTTTWTPYIISR